MGCEGENGRVVKKEADMAEESWGEADVSPEEWADLKEELREAEEEDEKGEVEEYVVGSGRSLFEEIRAEGRKMLVERKRAS